MPANKKYLNTSPLQRFAKISAGLLGGYLVTVSLFLALSFWINHINVLMTLRYGGIILWAFLFVFAFLLKNGWKVWAIYIVLTLLCCGLIYLGKIYNPII